MKRSLSPYRPLAILLFFIATSASAQTINPLFRHLPPNAKEIYHINLPVLTSKLSWNEIISNIPPSKSGSDQEMMGLLKAPAEAGIDINQDIFVAHSGKVAKADSASFITVILHLADSGKFGALVRKGTDIRTFRLPQGRAVGKDKMSVAYDNKLAVFTIVTLDKPAADAAKTAPGDKKAVTVAPSFNSALFAARRSVAALQGFPSSIYTTDPDFLAGFSDDADFHIWAPQGSGLATMLKTMGKKNQGMSDALTGRSKTSQRHLLTAIRFDAGKIVMRTLITMEKDSVALLKKFNSRPLNTDLIARLPGKDLLGMINLHLDLSALTDLLEQYKLRDKADSALSSLGFAVTDIPKAFKGDFLLAAVAPSAPAGDTTQYKEPFVYFVTTINDLGTFMKLTSKLPLSKDSASGGKGMFGKMKTAYTLKDNILVVSSNKQRTDSYFSNTTRRSTELVSDHVAGAPVSVVVDIKAVAAYLQGMSAQPSSKTQQMLHFMNALDRLTIAGGRLVDGTKSETYIELKMADASENSLRSIFKLLH
ncbi:DUF4836 family protein [Flavitalea sp. BT771]|uniref:DUF4836 family protein n=1 Tax=Flavitalea sp. BT771 TaxID=3063329 RepID=UPI0026E19322|nr:DUF4836 family protein [Flavitalea sp. BT771]MDO6433223.1 DUF4836 family protein [Flavitalea sp. BT771]MDV6221501.1 DUF4836 family protein [Flavitalea sp. BT771]